MINADLGPVLRLQSGAISRSQAEELGLSSRHIRALLDLGTWVRLVPGIYAATPELGWRTLAWAGLLKGGPAAVIGGPAAAHLHGLLPQPSPPILIQGAAQYRGEPQPWWRFERTVRRGRGEPARTGIEDAILDSWTVLPDDEFIALIGKAVSDRRTTLKRLQSALGERSRMPRRRDLLAIVGEVKAGALSPLERRYLRDVERAHGLPRGERQVAGGGQFRDVAYRQWRVIVELDGRLGHEGAARFRDMERDNAHLLAGHATLRFGWSDVRWRPCEVAAQVASLLQMAGWPGELQPCRACRLAA